MATKRIETQLSIKAIDQYSGMLKNMRTVTGRFADGVRTEMSRLQNLRGPLKLIEDFRKQQQVVSRSGEALERQRERVRQLKQAITSTRNPTAQMRREFERARASADRLERQHQQNRRALSGLQGQLRQAGVNTGDLSGEQRRLAGSIDRVTTAFGHQMERMRRLETMQTRIAEARERMDRSLATAANLSFVGNASMQTGRRILTGLSGPVQQAVEFETAMSDVRKVVDFDSPESFAQMSDDILELSTRIPMAADGLAQIVAAGGQSGLENEELLQFAEMAAKIGVAFDISADHAGTSMAKIKTALGLSVDETGSLFDAINHLSNKMASTAPDVLNFTTRVAVDGEVKGFSATETMAFGSAMIAAGASAEVASTSFRNMGMALAKGAASTPKQRAAFKLLGLDASEVAKRMQEDAVGTTLDVMKRINELPEHLRSSTISQIFGDEARALAPLIGNLDLLRDSLGLVSDEQEYLGSADKEYAERAKTTANNLQLMRNQMARLGISIGEVVLPPLNDLLEMSQGVIERMVAWTKEHPKLTKWLVIGAAAVGGMAVAGGALLTAAAGLIGTMAVLRFGLVGLGARAAFAAGDLMGVGGAFRGLTRLPRFALSTLLTPVRWTSRLVSRIPWALLVGGKFALSGLLVPVRWTTRLVLELPWVRLVGRLALSSLITPLSWTAALLPNFAPALKRFTGFRRSASAEITRLSTHVGRESAAMQRSLSRIPWGRLLKWGGIFGAVYTALSPSDLGDGTISDERREELRNMDPQKIREAQIREMNAVPDGLEPEQEKAGKVVQRYRARGSLPTEEARQELRDHAAYLREEIAKIEADIGNLADGPMKAVIESQLEMKAEPFRKELEGIESELGDMKAVAGELTEALKLLHGTEVAPEINTESIELAIDRLVELSALIEGLPSGRMDSRPAPKPSASAARPPAPRPAGARATGGPVRTGLPYLVNERTPRSEWFVPSRSGGVLNVTQAQTAFRSYLSAAATRPVGGNPELARLHRGAQGLRAASLAVLTSSALAAPVAAQPAQQYKPGDGAVTVQIENFTVQVPSGVSDPDTIADLVSDRIGQRVAATITASHYD